MKQLALIILFVTTLIACNKEDKTPVNPYEFTYGAWYRIEYGVRQDFPSYVISSSEVTYAGCDTTLKIKALSYNNGKDGVHKYNLVDVSIYGTALYSCTYSGFEFEYYNDDTLRRLLGAMLKQNAL